MTILSRSLLLLATVSLLSACKKENDIPVLVIDPTERDIDVTSGQVMSFLIEGRSDNTSLARLVITSKRGNGFTTTVKDSTLSGERFIWDWEFQVAHATESYNELYTFTLFDADGEDVHDENAVCNVGRDLAHGNIGAPFLLPQFRRSPRVGFRPSGPGAGDLHGG